MIRQENLKTLEILERDDRFKLEAKYTLIKGENFVNGICFSLLNIKNEHIVDIIGEIILVEPIKNMFTKNEKGELEIASLKVDYKYKGEGIEALLLEIAIAYAKKMNQPLVVMERHIIDILGRSFFERRGFKPEPVVYHQIVLVLGDNYVYNLDNIEECCHEFLDENKVPESQNAKVIDKELLKEIVELIVKVKKIANDLEYLPIWAKDIGVGDIGNIESLLTLPEAPDLRNIRTLEELKGSLSDYISQFKILEALLNRLGIEREDKYFNELPLLQAEPFVHALQGIMLSKVIGNEGNEGNEKYFVSVYDLSDEFLPVGSNKKLGEEIAIPLAPATLFKEGKENFEEIFVC